MTRTSRPACTAKDFSTPLKLLVISSSFFNRCVYASSVSRRAPGLDAEIAVGEEFVQVEYDYPDFHLSMSCFLCSLLSGSLTLKEHESARWLRAEELDAVDWLPADRTAAASLRRFLSEKNG